MRRVLAAVIPLLAMSWSAASAAPRQGVTTAAITGVVRDERGNPVASAQVDVVNRSNGFVVRATTRDDGRYVASGLDVGGPYAIAVRRIGYARTARDSLYVTIGQTLRVDLGLVSQAVALQAITSSARADGAYGSTHPVLGVGTLISDSLTHRLPISDRDIYGLVRLTPQMSTWYGLAAAGASPRVNAVLIDGSSEQGLYGGQAAAGIWGGKSISVEAVKEYQVLLTPFDVRYGNFAGALINAVTRSGTNELRGSAFYYGRYQALSRNVPFLRDAQFQRTQTGFTLGGPLVKSSAHFFVASEFQRLGFPTVGPYVGQSADATPPLRVSPDTLARFQNALSQWGLGGGSAGPVTARNPLANIFARVDVSLARIASRLVVRENYSRTDSTAFSRPSAPPTANCRSIICFPLSSAARRQVVWKDATVAQLLTTLSGGSYNELIAGRLTTTAGISPVLRQPLVIVQLGQTSLDQTLQAGAYEVAQGDKTDNESVELTDNLTVPRGWHSFTIGASTQLFRVRRVDLRGAFGVWTFPSIDALAQGQAQTYRVSRDFGGADVTVPGAQYAIYAGDRWDVTRNLTVTYGLRADIPVLNSAPASSGKMDSIFGRRTDVVPSGRVHWSPRIGFSSALADGRTRITGGAGAFMGRPPLSWIINAYANYGMPRTLTCGSATARGGAPAFSPDAANPPLACANGQGFTLDSVGSVNLIDRKLAFPQNLRSALAVERDLPWSVTARLEGQYTRALHELFFVNRNLAEPTTSDAHGRVMYGTIGSNARSTPTLAKAAFNADVIELTNQSKDYSYSVTAELAKRFSGSLSANGSFTYGHARDVQSHRLTRNPAFDNWRLGRTVVGRQDVATLGTSDFDQPFRVVGSGTYGFHRGSWTTDVSLYYLGGSGFPFTYLAGGDQQTGDLNADGTPLNDPIYIPRDANDSTEIVFDPRVFSVASQRSALEAFIEGASCLRKQRGRIMQRNSCRTPWTNTMNVAVRQSFAGERGHPIAVELQLFNALNFINRRWGLIPIPSGLTTVTSQVNLLTHTRQTTTAPAQSVFQFDPSTRRFDAGNVDSYYQIQLGVRYSF
jgi:hypothetical protein